MTEKPALYQRFAWSTDDQRLEPQVIRELDEIDEIVRAISEMELDCADHYTTVSL